MKLILVFLGIFMMSISSVCNAQEKAKGPVYMTDTGTKIHDIIVRKNEARERLYKKLKKALK